MKRKGTNLQRYVRREEHNVNLLGVKFNTTSSNGSEGHVVQLKEKVKKPIEKNSNGW